MITENPTFDKALRLLAHPFSLAALGLLAANDLLFRWLWPSWWTGKLGDLAWLAFAPFALAAGLSWLLPWRGQPRWHEMLTFGLAFAACGLGFTAVKTIPWVNNLATRSAAWVLGAPPSLAFDPTDLLALPAIAAALFLYYHSSRAPLTPIAPERISPRRIRGLLALPLAASVLLADAAAPDLGFTCFQLAGDRILASGGYISYASTDGGRTWQALTEGGRAECTTRVPAPEEWQEADGPQPGQRYRYQPESDIELSTDGGQTWTTVYRLSPVSEQQRMYILKTRPGNPYFRPGPMDAIADPRSGNMLFAMGQQGVLLRAPDGQWQWSTGIGAAGAYHPLENFPDAAAFDTLLGGMVFMAAGLAFLIYSSLALRWTRRTARVIVLVLAWLAWLILDALFPPATMTNYGATVSSLGLLCLALLIIPLAIEQTFRLVRRAGARPISLLLAVSLAGGLLYFLPYLLWLYGALPAFDWATVTGLFVTALAVLAGVLAARRHPRRAGTAGQP